MTIAARLPDGTLARFPTPEAFGLWLTASRPRGLVQILNGTPSGSRDGRRDPRTSPRLPSGQPGVHGSSASPRGASGLTLVRDKGEPA